MLKTKLQLSHVGLFKHARPFSGIQALKVKKDKCIDYEKVRILF